MATDPHATAPIKRSSRTRRPTNQLMAAPASGAKMIRLRRLDSIFTWSVLGLWSLVFGFRSLVCQSPRIKDPRPKTKDQRPKTSTKHKSSQLQNTRVINIKRLAIAKDRDDDPQTNSSFRRSDRHDDEHKELSRHVLKKTGKRDKRQIHGVQHQLNAHEH